MLKTDIHTDWCAINAKPTLTHDEAAWLIAHMDWSRSKPDPEERIHEMIGRVIKGLEVAERPAPVRVTHAVELIDNPGLFSYFGTKEACEKLTAKGFRNVWRVVPCPTFGATP